jgi:hypothetical protein
MLNKCGKRRIAIGRVDISSSLRLAPLVNENVMCEKIPKHQDNGFPPRDNCFG